MSCGSGDGASQPIQKDKKNPPPASFGRRQFFPFPFSPGSEKRTTRFASGNHCRQIAQKLGDLTPTVRGTGALFF